MNSLILLLIGVCMGFLLHCLYLQVTCKIAATLNIDTSNDEKDIYMFEVDVPLESLTKYKMIRVRIADKTAPIMNS